MILTSSEKDSWNSCTIVCDTCPEALLSVCGEHLKIRSKMYFIHIRHLTLQFVAIVAVLTMTTLLVSCDNAELVIPELNLDLVDQGPNPDCEGSPENEKCLPFQKRGPTCLDKRRILGLEPGEDEFVIVDAFIGQDIQLDCHYCHEKDDDVAKNWYYNDRLFLSNEREVPQRLELPLSERKFVIDDHHMLTIKNFSESEGAIYFCQGLHDISSKFNFLVDVVPKKGGPEPIAGNEKEYQKFYKEYVKPTNKALAKAHVLQIKDWLKLKDNENFDITYEWSPWGGCNVCGRDKGIKRRHGKCRLVIPVPQKTNSTVRHKGPLKKLKFGIQFSCQSLLLDRFLSPELVKRISKLSDFVETAKCSGTCLIDPNIEQIWQESAAERRNLEIVTIRKVTEQNLILGCPRPDLETGVVWAKDRSIIPSRKLESGHLTLTVKSELEFRELRIEDGGNYTCFIDSVPSHVYELSISEKDKRNRDVSWVWTSMWIFSLICFIIWLFLVIVTGTISKRIQRGYKPVNQVEEREALAVRYV